MVILQVEQAMIAYPSLICTIFASSATKSTIDPIIKVKYAWFARLKTSRVDTRETR